MSLPIFKEELSPLLIVLVVFHGWTIRPFRVRELVCWEEAKKAEAKQREPERTSLPHKSAVTIERELLISDYLLFSI
jgi:hypothetical protein